MTTRTRTRLCRARPRAPPRSVLRGRGCEGPGAGRLRARSGRARRAGRRGTRRPPRPPRDAGTGVRALRPRSRDGRCSPCQWTSRSARTPVPGPGQRCTHAGATALPAVEGRSRRTVPPSTGRARCPWRRRTTRSTRREDRACRAPCPRAGPSPGDGSPALGPTRRAPTFHSRSSRTGDDRDARGPTTGRRHGPRGIACATGPRRGPRQSRYRTA